MSIKEIKTYKIVTFGCQMNARDSEKLAGILEDKGFSEVADEDTADIVIFNTCTVRENANQKLYGHIGQLKKSYLENKNKIIGICGCMMQEKDEVEKIVEKYPQVKLIFGTHNIDEFGDLIDEVIYTNKKVIKVYDEAENIEKTLPTKRVFDFKCGINIMFGCNNFCTYCIVPYVRGRERSRDVDSIVSEIKKVVAEGVIEIMLLGQNVNSYSGKAGDSYKFNDNNKVTFPELLNEVAKIDGLKRIRFMTSHPKDLSDELIEVIKKNSNICRHIHLPVQSGSDEILKAMNRHYDRSAYLKVIDKIRNNIEDVGITTDIIVGFPGETEKDFEDTLSLINQVSYDAVFTFEYSKRTGTKAAEMENQVPENVVKERFKRLLKVVEDNSGRNVEKYVGRTMDVLVEGEDKVSGKLTGRLSNNYLVHFNGDKELIGRIIDVKLTKSCKFYFEGEIVSKWK
ncbi:MAG: tRNA (N6-isopentenyl adenosine(37)-C2)-methylthiotransferase MiaB [Lachnospiraceae bacterium]|nr:tRNA (N6-isopentenyl adenosine(37)-C2)-methylthiotransferase MiaB [Lachnospiraceae bacterium]